MTLDEFKKQQKRDLADFKRKASGPNRDEAVAEARERLRAAKIIDKKDRLTPFYR